MNTQKSVYKRLFSKVEKTELETHKVELNKIDDLLNWSKGGDTDAFEELAELVKVAQKQESKAYKKLEKVEEKQKEAKKLKTIAKELGVDSVLNTIEKAEDLLNLKQKNIRSVIKLLQNASNQKI